MSARYSSRGSRDTDIDWITPTYRSVNRLSGRHRIEKRLQVFCVLLDSRSRAAQESRRCTRSLFLRIPRRFPSMPRSSGWLRLAASTGHQVWVNDLYAEGFEARLDRDDMGGNAPEGYFNVGREQARAWRKGTLAADIAAQIEHLRWAELVILQFPLWWYGPPASLKGWMDRVFLPGCSYGRENWFETGGLAGKKRCSSLPAA